MFEKYTEKARRVIFFARYEASAFGSPHIETEHLLLGLFREDKSIARDYLGDRVSSLDIRSAVERDFPARESTPTSIDLPLSDECKRILAYSAEESMRLNHDHISPEHLLLGILREENCYAARLLRGYGLALDPARTTVNAGSKELPRKSNFPVIRLDGIEGTASLPNSHHLPNIGEKIVLRQPDGVAHAYRVVDVTWDYAHAEESTMLHEITIKVAAENL
jgi:ATP-dependent Clp protease ATP-binding subunit ClpA